jgi:acyl dehydratase
MIGLDELRAKVGAEIGLSGWITVDQSRIDGFAELTGDHQFIHVDPVRASAETPFGGAIAHGFLTLSLLSAMAYDALPAIEGTAMGVNYGFNRLRFLAPVPAGASIRGRFRLARLDETRSGEVTSTYDVQIEIEGREKPVLAAEWLTRSYLARRDQTG